MDGWTEGMDGMDGRMGWGGVGPSHGSDCAYRSICIVKYLHLYTRIRTHTSACASVQGGLLAGLRPSSSPAADASAVTSEDAEAGGEERPALLAHGATKVVTRQDLPSLDRGRTPGGAALPTSNLYEALSGSAGDDDDGARDEDDETEEAEEPAAWHTAAGGGGDAMRCTPEAAVAYAANLTRTKQLYAELLRDYTKAQLRELFVDFGLTRLHWFDSLPKRELAWQLAEDRPKHCAELFAPEPASADVQVAPPD